jgi:protein gp37
VRIVGENSAIQWTDHTFNPWIGCTRVSPGCVNCYAESFARRYGMAEWGPQAQRVRTSAANWRKPLAWNRKAEQEGRRYKVLCASLADVFEKNDQLVDWRTDLWRLIDSTPWLDWLLPTKRPENIPDMAPVLWFDAGRWPANLWIGTSVETQEQADKRIPALLDIPAPVRFLSCEPLLGPLDLFLYLVTHFAADDPRHEPWRNGVEWVIAGGESGPQARPMHENWVRSLRDQCQAAGVPFFFKQWGQWLPADQRPDDWYNGGTITLAADKQTEGCFIRVASKHAAGRRLDGREWNEMPGGRP